MATISAVCRALSDTVKNAVNEAGQTFYGYEDVPDQSQYPCILVEPDGADYLTSFGQSTDQWILRAFVICSREPNASVGQRLLKQLVTGWGPISIPKIIYENSSLGLPGTTAVAMSMGAFGADFESNQLTSVGAILTIKVLTPADDFDPYGEG